MITLEQAKQALGKTGQTMTDQDIQRLIANMDLLCMSWLDSYERTIFNGMTIDQLVRK